MKNTKQPKSSLLYSIILIASLVLFLLKGIQYAILESYIPISVSVTIVFILYFLRRREKSLNIVIKIWAILMITWSVIRLFIGGVDHFGKELMENHLQENMGVFGILISIIFLIFGFFLLNRKNRNDWFQKRTT
ncbi:hypothetical protein [uncultured Aquimarina sp.]|uniref:hypothetical protein n=1 Tax=uncultured Aquimarina sp. TaxID=575652 RepID=UPI0026232E38|nr:hypothetical protein [uncultured Aquimarina sp.]